MNGDPQASDREPDKAVAEVLRAYIGAMRDFQVVDDAVRAHLDTMLTWVIGLMGAGVLAVANLTVCTLHERVWATAPWVFGILLAVVGGLFGDAYPYSGGLHNAGEIYLAQLQLALEGAKPESGRKFFERREHDPYLTKADRANRVARWCYRVALVSLAVGMLCIFGRVTSC